MESKGLGFIVTLQLYKQNLDSLLDRNRKGKVKEKSLYSTLVVPSVTRLVSMEANGVPFPPCLCQCSVLRVFKAMATRIRGKSKQMLKSLKIEPETSRSERRALAHEPRLLLVVSSEQPLHTKGHHDLVVVKFLTRDIKDEMQ